MDTSTSTPLPLYEYTVKTPFVSAEGGVLFVIQFARISLPPQKPPPEGSPEANSQRAVWRIQSVASFRMKPHTPEQKVGEHQEAWTRISLSIPLLPLAIPN